MKRRAFLKSSIAGLVLAQGAARAQIESANDRIVVAVVGIRDRGMDLAEELARQPNVELRYLADVDTRLFQERVARIESITGKAPQCVQDFRKTLDDPEIDAIATATPDHWHALITLWACQAGKDVYVEKPTSHSVWESRKMVEAARKYKRVVQVGTQNRSADYIYKALDYIQSGGLGDIHFVRVMNSKMREDIGRPADSTVPAGVDYDLWLGPAPGRPFNENHFHYNWHWFWDYGGGDVVNDGVHQIDLARWMTGQRLPKAVSSAGGMFYFDDARETPDTQTITWEFEKLTIVLEQTLWTPYMKKIPFELRDQDRLPNWPFAATRVELCGTKNFMYLSRMGGGWQVYDAEGQSIAIQHGRFSPANTAHIVNFLDCIRTRETPRADIEEGHYSTLLAHYGNIAYRVGRRLHIDPVTEGFLHDDEANTLVKRTYRAPYIVPDQV